jgi:hypothetical protein
LNDIDLVLFKLSEGDMSKAKIIENIPVEDCYNWFYLLRVRELNDMRIKIAEWKKLKN